MNLSPLRAAAFGFSALTLSTAISVASSSMQPAYAQINDSEPTTITSQQSAEVLASDAQSVTSVQPPVESSAPPVHLLPQPTSVTIPANTGVIVSFLAPVAIDVNEGAYPMTLPLSQAITDTFGNVLIPENSPVSVVIQPEEGGAKVTAQSIVIGGKIVPISASSPLIPGTTITHVRANDRAADDGATMGRMVASGFGFFNGGDPDAFDRGGMLGNLIGMVSGRRDESSRVVQIPQGSVYVLSLEESVTLRD